MMAEPEEFIIKHFGNDTTLFQLYEQLGTLRSDEKYKIHELLSFIDSSYGTCATMLLLYNQQESSGFILQAKNGKPEEKILIEDHQTGIRFQVQWNPERELRKNHALLIGRGIIILVKDKKQLVHVDELGNACYLCAENIRLQNPAEIIFPISLLDETFYAGANFARLGNHHFTLFNKEHQPQHYRKKIIDLMFDFLDKTEACFRVIYNGLAGASIEQHEHMQATTDYFPIEKISISPKRVLKNNGKIKISQPFYYTSILLFESSSKEEISQHADLFIKWWHTEDPEQNTENLVAVKNKIGYRLFLFPRNRKLLAGKGKTSALASFEVSGNMVLSDESTERNTFDNISLAVIRQMLAEVDPGIPFPAHEF